MSYSLAAQLQRGVMIEFDFAVLDGHALLLDVCRARLETEGVNLDAGLMARVMGGRSFSAGLNALASRQHKTIDVPTVIADCNAELTERLTADLAKIPAGFLAFLKAALAKNLKVVLVTRLEGEVVLPALTGVQGDKLVVLRDVPNGFGFCTWEGWRRATRKSELHDRLCVAVAGSGFSVKGALNSGMCVIAKPGPLTDYQDFSGSDKSITAYTAALADDITAMLRM